MSPVRARSPTLQQTLPTQGLRRTHPRRMVRHQTLETAEEFRKGDSVAHKQPSYRLHKQSGQAIVTLPEGGGGRKASPPAPHTPRETPAESPRLIKEWEASGRRLPQDAASADLTINELILRFWPHV